MSKFFWCEDCGAGYQFWFALLKHIHPEITVESKCNNSRLAAAAGKIRDDGNEYYIIIDNPPDNPEAIREVRTLKRNVTGKTNVQVILVHSFEFVVLSFHLLEKWVFAERDELREKRANLLLLREQFVRLINFGGTIEDIIEFKKRFLEVDFTNTERLASKLLYNITRNTGFETDKRTLGKCFTVDCCQWSDRQPDDECGLDNDRISSRKKAEMLVEHSILKEKFERVGL